MTKRSEAKYKLDRRMGQAGGRVEAHPRGRDLISGLLH